jgi:hypothetical protein
MWCQNKQGFPQVNRLKRGTPSVHPLLRGPESRALR